jgi:hypothetical protein
MFSTPTPRNNSHATAKTDSRETYNNPEQGGLTTKIHAVVDTNALPVQRGLTPGEAHDNRLCSVLLNELSRDFPDDSQTGVSIRVLRPCRKTDARCRRLPAPRLARTVVEGVI